MLDTIKIEFDWQHQPFGDMANITKESGVEKGPYANRKKVRGRYEWGVLHLRSIRQGRAIEMEGSPAMYLQGQNVFGSNNVRWIVLEAVADAMKRIGIRFEREPLKAAVLNARIRHLDLACSIRLPSGVEPSAVIRPLQIALLDSGCEVVCYGKQTVLMPRASAPSKTFYDKKHLVNKSLAKKWAKEKYVGADFIAERLDSVVRFETRLKSRWLKSMGLETVGKWSNKTARDILATQLNTAFAEGNITVKPLPTLYYDLEPKERDVFALWLSGFDLGLHREERTLATYQKEFEKHGINLRSRPPNAQGTNFELAEVLRSSKRWLAYPKSARKHGLIACSR
jgi:hypothetical protein